MVLIYLGSIIVQVIHLLRKENIEDILSNLCDYNSVEKTVIGDI